MFYKKTINKIIEELAKTVTDNYEFETKTKENWLKAMKRIEKLEQNNTLFLEALNEQRTKITQCIEVIKYLCSKNEIKVKTKEETKKKKEK